MPRQIRVTAIHKGPEPVETLAAAMAEIISKNKIKSNFPLFWQGSV
jgi:hypothetical protein